MAGKPALRIELSLAKDAIADAVLKSTPAKVRRIIRGSMGKATRASAKRVKQNVKANYRTGALEKAEGQKVATYKDVVVGMVGARIGFARRDDVFGNVDPARYDHLVEKGRTVSEGKPWLVLRFRSLVMLDRFLSKRSWPKDGRKIRRRTEEPYPGWTRIARKHGRFAANRVRLNNRGKGYVLFLRKVGPARAFEPVERDATNFGAEADSIITNDLNSRL